MVTTEYVRSGGKSCGLENKQKIERLQRRASRIVLKNSRELTSEAIIERLGCRYSIDEMNILKNQIITVLRGLFPICSRGILTSDAIRLWHSFIHITLGLARIFFCYKGAITFNSQFLAFFNNVLFLEPTIHISFSFFFLFLDIFIFQLHYVCNIN